MFIGAKTVLFDEKIIVTSLYTSIVDFNKTKEIYVPARDIHSITYRVSGKVSISHGEKTLVSEKGCLTYVPAGLPYRTEILSEGRMFVVHFTANEVCEPGDALVISPKYPMNFHNMFSEICSRFKLGRENDLYCMSMLYGILAETRNELLRIDGKKHDVRLHKIKESIDFGFSDPLMSVEALADEMGVSQAYFRRLFGNAYGMSPNAYIKKVRIENAKALLRTGYYSVTETAIRCGFDSISYFSYEFHRMTGITPREYASKFFDT